MASKRCCYEILEVSREATAVEVKKAYRKLALANHPDRNPGDDAAIARFKEASEAYEILSSSEKRVRYDRYGYAGVSGSNGGPSFTDVGDIFDAFGDLFDGFGVGGFGNRGGRSGPRAQRGAHLRTSVSIDLLDAASGCEREIELTRRENCTTCDGSGARPGSSPEKCDYCGGAGRLVQSQGFFRVQTTCPACQGEGAVVRDKCEECRGSGTKKEKVRLQIKVPAGVDTGMQLCLRGEGEPGRHSGGRGDLYVDIKVADHPLFQRDDRNLTCAVPITYTQAALGTKLDVPVLGGRHSLTIPPGTQPGDVFTLRGEGMPDPHGGRRGNLFVQIQVEVPHKLNERQEELLRELAELENANVSPHRKSFFESLKEYFVPHDNAAEE